MPERIAGLLSRVVMGVSCRIRVHPVFVMPGLVPGIHVFDLNPKEDVDGRDKPGHDER
jgi:hypothetical protein